MLLHIQWQMLSVVLQEVVEVSTSYAIANAQPLILAASLDRYRQLLSVLNAYTGSSLYVRCAASSLINVLEQGSVSPDWHYCISICSNELDS